MIYSDNDLYIILDIFQQPLITYIISHDLYNYIVPTVTCEIYSERKTGRALIADLSGEIFLLWLDTLEHNQIKKTLHSMYILGLCDPSMLKFVMKMSTLFLLWRIEIV